MPVTVRGTDILFNDGTTQSTAGGAVNTTNVLNATAGASAGAVGTYGLMKEENGTARAPGDTVAGSGIYFSDASGGNSFSYASGTWRCMGYKFNTGSSGGRVTLWLRIS